MCTFFLCTQQYSAHVQYLHRMLGNCYTYLQRFQWCGHTGVQCQRWPFDWLLGTSQTTRFLQRPRNRSLVQSHRHLQTNTGLHQCKTITFRAFQSTSTCKPIFFVENQNLPQLVSSAALEQSLIKLQTLDCGIMTFNGSLQAKLPLVFGSVGVKYQEYSALINYHRIFSLNVMLQLH